MGNEESHQKKEFSLQINHQKFDNSKIVCEDGKRLLQITIASSQQEYKRWKAALSKHKEENTCLLLPVKQEFKTNGMCGSTGTLKIFYQNYPYLLTEEMYTRKGKRSIFTEQQIWYLLYNLLKSKETMRYYELSVGDIRPQNIFLGEEGNMKVSNLHSWPSEITNYQKAWEKKITYLAPEQVEQLQMGSLDENMHECSELFSIGLTLLSVIFLTPLDSIYQVSKQFKFDYNQASLALNELRKAKGYSQVLKGTILNLCNFEALKRMTLDEMLLFLEKNEAKILKKQNFFIDNAPQKLHQEVLGLRAYMASLNPINPFGKNFIASQSFKNHVQNEMSKKVDPSIQAGKNLGNVDQHKPEQGQKQNEKIQEATAQKQQNNPVPFKAETSNSLAVQNQVVNLESLVKDQPNVSSQSAKN